MVTILSNPNEFFRNRVEETSMARPAIVVLLAVFSNLLAPFLITVRIYELSPESLQSYILFGQGLAIAAAVFGTSLKWFLVSGFTYSASLFYSRDGEFRQLFRLIGWGFVPQIFSGLVLGTTTYYVFHTLDVTAFQLSNMQTVNAYIRNHQFFVIGKLLSLVFVVWSGLLWAFALKNVRKLDRVTSVKITAIPVLLIVLWQLLRLFVL